MSYRIVNVVCTFSLNCTLNLSAINSTDFNTVYKPKNFPALMKKFKTGTALLFSNGKCVISGAKSEADARKLTFLIARMVRQYKPKISNFKVQNIVATVDLKPQAVKTSGTIFNLADIYKQYPNCLYEPQRYSALTMDALGVKAIIFHNGKVNFTKAKTIDDLDIAFHYLLEILRKINYIY